MNIFVAILTLFFTLFTFAAASHEIHPLLTRHPRIPRQPSLAKRCKSRPTTPPEVRSCAPHPDLSHTTLPFSPTPPRTMAQPRLTTVKSSMSSPIAVPSVQLVRPSPFSPLLSHIVPEQITTVSGPNGNIYWLNCGLTSGGWKPPHVEISDLIFVPLTTSIKSPSSPFKACKPYISYFEKYGQQLGIPSIILASFAMQESSCNPNTIGGAGEQGLMQITKDKCGGAPGGNCRDPVSSPTFHAM